MSTSVDFIVVLVDIIASLISLGCQVNLKTIEDAASSWFEEAEHQEKLSSATCKSAQAAMQHPQFRRLLSFMTTGADPEGSWKRSIDYQYWTLGTAIKKLVKHQFMAANPGNLVVAVDFNLDNGYSVQGSAFPGVKHTESKTLEEIRRALETCGVAFSRSYPDLISHIISMTGAAEVAGEAPATLAGEAPVTLAGEAPATLAEAVSLIAELKAAKAEALSLIAELKAELKAAKAAKAEEAPKAAPTPLAEDVRKMVEGNIPLSHGEVVAKAAQVAQAAPAAPAAPAAEKARDALNWLKAIKKHLPVAPAAAPAAAPVAPAAAWILVGANGKAAASGGARAGAGGGR
jgi:hypothetical protein